MRLRVAIFVLLLAGFTGPLSAEARTPTPAKKASVTRSRPLRRPVNFTGVWELDMKASAGVSARMKDAVLSVSQRGDRILLTPEGDSKVQLQAEEIVADGRPYEKSIGRKDKGLVTAAWGKEKQSLWLQITAGPADKPTATSRSIWTLSSDGRVWVRETVNVSPTKRTRSRLVFRRGTEKKKTPDRSRGSR